MELLASELIVLYCFLLPTPGWLVAPLAMMPGQIPDPSVTAGSLPGLGPLTGLPSSALTAEELKYADIRNIGAMIAPLHFLEVKLGKRPQPVKSEVSVSCHSRDLGLALNVTCCGTLALLLIMCHEDQ